jgi:hypothetical protein
MERPGDKGRGRVREKGEVKRTRIRTFFHERSSSLVLVVVLPPGWSSSLLCPRLLFWVVILEWKLICKYKTDKVLVQNI